MLPGLHSFSNIVDFTFIPFNVVIEKIGSLSSNELQRVDLLLQPVDTFFTLSVNLIKLSSILLLEYVEGELTGSVVIVWSGQ